MSASHVPPEIDLKVPWVAIGGLPIAAIDREQSARLMIEAAVARRGSGRAPLLVTSANGQVISMCARDAEVRGLLLSADLIHADGMPLVFASRLKCRTPLPERVATTDLFHDVARAAPLSGATFYLLGATPTVIEQAVCKVQEEHPQLTIAGYRHGYFGPEETNEVIAEIDACAPDVLWIGMGMPGELALAVHLRTSADQCRPHQDVGRLVRFSVREELARAGMDAIRRIGVALSTRARAATIALSLSDHQPACAFSSAHRQHAAARISAGAMAHGSSLSGEGRHVGKSLRPCASSPSWLWRARWSRS